MHSTRLKIGSDGFAMRGATAGCKDTYGGRGSPWAAIAATLCLAGCTGSVSTENLNPDTYQRVGNVFRGVIVYPPALFNEISTKRVLVDREGNLIGRADNGTCVPVRSSRVVTLPDFGRPQRVFYEPGVLEANTFGVQITNGMLTAVNSESSPDRGQTPLNLANAIGALAAAGVGTLGVTPTPRGRPACNEGAVIEGYERMTLPVAAR